MISYILCQIMSGHDGSMYNADQYRSMCDQISSIDTNVSQCLRSRVKQPTLLYFGSVLEI